MGAWRWVAAKPPRQSSPPNSRAHRVTMKLLRLSDLSWPCSRADLMADNPSTWFPDDLSQAQPLSVFGYVLPEPTTPPEYNPLLFRAVESPPVQIDGVWRQAWMLEPVDPPAPEADWIGFGEWLGDEPAVAAAIATARTSTTPQGEPATSWYLPQAILAARAGNVREFAMAWGRFRAASGMSDEVSSGIAIKALEYRLPTDFASVFQASQPAQ